MRLVVMAARGGQPPHDVLRAEVRADLHDWATRYPVFDPARFPALALTTVAYLPAARREDRALAALVSLWIIAFDALVDEGDADAATLVALVARYDALFDDDGAGCSAPPPRRRGVGEQLDAALREIGARVAGYDPPTALRAWSAASWRATIAAIVRQRDLGPVGTPAPTYAAALPLLVDSIGVRPYLAIGAIVGREPGLAARLPAVTALAGECALAIRLANDLQTWEKDEREGGFNALVALRGELVRAEPALSVEEARERALATLRARLAASRVRCRAHLTAPGGAGVTEAEMVRLTEVVVGIYAAHDYHTYRDAGG